MTIGAGGQPATGIVVGFGSIGQRHARLMSELGLSICVVSRRPVPGALASIAEAVSDAPGAFLVIASETDRHMDDLRAARAAGHRGPVLVEKPLAAQSSDLTVEASQQNAWVGYNLRFAPAVQALRTALATASGDVVSVRMHAGQHLETWRPGRDARSSYSAHASRGGGVLRDLSHELDLSNWLWGRPVGFCTLGGRRGGITVDSDDCWSILMRTERSVDVSLSLNYFDRPATRYVEVTTTAGTLRCDLVAGVLSSDGDALQIVSDRDASYRAMWADLLGAANGGSSIACTFGEAAHVVTLIEAIERQTNAPEWVRC